MSEDIRKMIDKVKKFKQFISESNTTNYINWSDLPIQVKNDITENLRDNIRYIKEEYWNSEALRDSIDDSINKPIFKIEYKNVDVLYNELIQIGWGISEDNVKRLISALKNGAELDPIILENGKFFDGGHRLTAYKKMKKELIPTIDIGFLMNFDWEKWDNGQADF